MIVEAVAQVDAPRAAALQAQFAPAAGEGEPRDDGALPRESERTAALLAAVADVADATVQARVAQVRTILAGEGDRVVSFDDPDARWGYKAADKPFLGYKAHESLDPDSRLITGVDVVPGNANEAVRTDAVLAAEPTPRTPGAVIIGDGLYNNATTVAQVATASAALFQWAEGRTRERRLHVRRGDGPDGLRGGEALGRQSPGRPGRSLLFLHARLCACLDAGPA